MDAQQPTDPRRRLLRNARREAILVLSTWALALIWVVGYSYARGYLEEGRAPQAAHGQDGPPLEIVLGMPSWVFYGIFLPWLIATAFTVFFGLRILKDDVLQPAPDAERS
jgi:hypothetical protein